MRINFFLENDVTSQGPVSHNVLYYQHLFIDHLQVSFYANNYFEQLPIVSSAFHKKHISCVNEIIDLSRRVLVLNVAMYHVQTLIAPILFKAHVVLSVMDVC